VVTKADLTVLFLYSLNKKHQELCQLDEVGMSENDQKIQVQYTWI